MGQPFLESGLRVSGWRRARNRASVLAPQTLESWVFLAAEQSLDSSPPDVGLPVPGMQRFSWREALCVPRPTSSATLFLSRSVLGFCFLPLRECQCAQGALEDSPHQPLSWVSNLPFRTVLSLPLQISFSIDSPRTSSPVCLSKCASPFLPGVASNKSRCIEVEEVPATWKEKQTTTTTTTKNPYSVLGTFPVTTVWLPLEMVPALILPRRPLLPRRGLARSLAEYAYV